MEQIAAEIRRLKNEYPLDLSKNKVKEAISKMHTICGMSFEFLKKPEEQVLAELRTWQDKYNVTNADLIGKLRAKKQKDLDKVTAAHEQAMAKNEYKKAEDLSLKRCKILEEIGQYYASYEARRVHLEYRKKALGILGQY